MLAAAEAALGVACLARPGALASLAGVRVHRDDGRRFVRVLGVRHLVQAAVVAVRPTRAVLAGGAAVDALHGSTMLALAVLDRTQRRAALRNAAAAFAWSALEVGSAARGRRPGA